MDTNLSSRVGRLGSSTLCYVSNGSDIRTIQTSFYFIILVLKSYYNLTSFRSYLQSSVIVVIIMKSNRIESKNTI